MSMFRKDGGGYLNGIDATITDYTFETKEWPGKKGKDDYTTLSVELMVLLDGADEPVQTFVPAGFFYPENQSVSEDGKTLESDDERPIIREDTEFAGLILSLVEHGFPEELIANGRNFEPILGCRVTFAKVVDAEATAKFGKRKDKKDPKKEYNRDLLRVSALLGMPEAGSKKKAVKKTAKKAAAAPVKGAKRTAAPVEDVDNTPADEALLMMLADAKDNTISRKVIGSSVVRYVLTNKLDATVREMLRKTLSDEAYLAEAAERGIITYDGDDKAQPIGLPA